MQDINKFVNETDTDNVTLNKLKELGTKLTGQDNVQGETIAEVLDFINSNYSGGGSGSRPIIYINNAEDVKYAYKDEGFTTKYNKDELFETFLNGAVFALDGMYVKTNMYMAQEGMAMIMVDEGNIVYSSEYTHIEA